VNLQTQKTHSEVIVYDAAVIEQAGANLFDGQFWENSGCMVGKAQGRGSVLLLDTSFGPAVLRRYLRGGWAAGLTRDRYLYTGFERSRPLAELRMLARLYNQGLPVPHPLAAHCKRDGLFYRGSLLTRRILGATPLADLLADDSAGLMLWQATGQCIRKFHDQGVVHSDLNARNILAQSSGEIYLIDFDRARIRKGARRAFAANLKRLRRSLEKFWPDGQSQRLENSWESLMKAYSAGAGS
jgi:3-deoxy-D-manno-octulosonic acid kinase